MKKSKNDNIFAIIIIIFAVLLLVWIKNYIVLHTFDKDMYIVKREYTATSGKGTIELYTGECVEVILKKDKSWIQSKNNGKWNRMLYPRH